MNEGKTRIIFIISLVWTLLLWIIVWFSIRGCGYGLHDGLHGKNMPFMMDANMNNSLWKGRWPNNLTGSSLPENISSTKPIQWEQGPNLPENQLQENNI